MKDKVVKVYIQQYKYKAKVTIELDLHKAKMVKGVYKVYRIYTKTCNNLNSLKELVNKTSLQYNMKHLLQLEVTDIKYCQTMLDKLSELEWCEIIHIERNRHEQSI